MRNREPVQASRPCGVEGHGTGVVKDAMEDSGKSYKAAAGKQHNDYKQESKGGARTGLPQGRPW